MSKVIKLKTVRVTEEDREVMKYAKEFRDMGMSRTEAALAAAFFHKMSKMEKRIKQLEKGK